MSQLPNRLHGQLGGCTPFAHPLTRRHPPLKCPHSLYLRQRGPKNHRLFKAFFMDYTNYKPLECFVTLGTHSQLHRGQMSHICDIGPLKVKSRLKLSWNYSPYLVVMFNMESICCFSKSWCVIQVSQISPHVGIVNDAFLITLKPIKKKKWQFWTYYSKSQWTHPSSEKRIYILHVVHIECTCKHIHVCMFNMYK